VRQRTISIPLPRSQPANSTSSIPGGSGADPTLYSAKLLYDLFHTNYPTDDWINLQFNLHHNSRTDFLTFTTNNYGRIGYNALSNRMTCLNNLVKSAELNLNAECYKKLLKN
jgi:hypothetical protein